MQRSSMVTSGSFLALVLGVTVLILGPSPAAPVSGDDLILEIDDTTLTSYLKDAATGIQDVRPRGAQRGVNLDGSLRSRPGLPFTVNGNPFGAAVNVTEVSSVRVSTGTFRIEDVDLTLPGPGFSWSAGRSYNARQDDSGSHFDSDGPQGRNWFQSSMPEILLFEHATDNAKDIVYLIYGADRFAEYRRTGESSDVFKGRNGAAGLIEFEEELTSGEPDTYTLTDINGMEVTFFGFDADAGSAAGQLWRMVDPDGNTAFAGDDTTKSTAITNGFDGGRLAVLYDTADRRWTYTYTTLDGTKRLTEIVAETKSGGTWASPTGVVERGKVELEFYSDADDYGEDGDLQLVEITTPLTDSGVESVRKIYYRYYEGAYHASTNRGHEHALKYVVDFEGTRRFDWQDETFDEDFFTASNTTLEPYASAYFEYDSSHRVDEAWFNGDCGCSGSGNGTHLFEYESNGSYSDGTGYDTAWMGRTIVARPDGSYLTAYHDEAHQALSRVVTDADPDNTSPTPERWVTKVARNAYGLVTNVHSPANCTGYTHSSGPITSSTSAGLVTSFVFHGFEQDYAGFVKDRTSKTGTSGSAYMEETFAYGTRSVTVGGENLVRAFVDERHVYDEATTTSEGTGSRETASSRDYHSGELRQADGLTTAPSVSTANNGSGSATTRRAYREADGTTTWTKDENGVLTYREYTDGQVTKVIQDADTDLLTEPNANYVNASGVHLTTTLAYDAQGRSDTTTAPDGQVTKRYYSKLADGRLVTLTFADFETSPSTKFYGPVSVSVTNHAGKVEVSGTVALSGNSTTSALTAHVDETDDDPITALDLGSLVQMATSHYSKSGGKLDEARAYFSIPASGEGTDGTHYDPTLFGYDDSGRRTRTKEASGTIRRSVYDIHGGVTEQWLGTNDSTFSGGEASGTDNMVKTVEVEYDSGNDDGNRLVTKRTAFVEDSTTDKRETTFEHDVMGRVILETRPVSPHAFHKYDHRGRRVATGLFSATTNIVVGTDDPTTETSNRLALSETEFDEKGQVVKSTRHEIDASDGSSDDTLEAENWYDAAGRRVKTDGDQLTKVLYDSLGRQTHRFVLAQDDDSVYADMDDVTGDHVLEEAQTTYESDSSDVLMESTISRLHDDHGAGLTTGALDTNADADVLAYTAANLEGRIQITAHWYDRFGRVTDTVRYGTYGGSTFDRDGLSVPTRSDTALRTTFTYNDDGDLEEIEDPRGTVTYREQDGLGRVTKEVRNYDASVNSGNPSGTDDNVTVKYEFTDGLQTKIIADLPSGSTDQETAYTYGTAKGVSAGDSKIATGHLLQEVEYPDSASGSDVVSYAYNAQGERIYTKDQAGNVIEVDLDDGGREEHRRITTLASGFDGAVRRISMTYTDLGQVELVTQYDNATAGSGSVVDEVRYSYDGWGNTTTFEQDVNSAVGASGSVDDYEVSYTFAKATLGRNTVRRTAVTLPSGNVVNYSYSATDGKLDNAASRMTTLIDGATRKVRYEYLGLAQVVGTTHLEPEIQWLLFDGAGAYPDLDRFGRVVSSRWTKDLATDVDFYDVDISYDRSSNITLIEDNVHAGFDVSYTMDDVDRLTRAQEGTWGGSSITSESRDQEWTLSHVGNWDGAKLDLNGDGDWGDADEYDDTRSHNDVNELTARDVDSDSTDDYTHAYDAVGNMTDDGESYEYEYDAFGRMRFVKNQSDALVAEYVYNGLGFLISEHADTDDDGDVDANDKWFHNAYDERWRKLATFREDDSDPKEEFLPHQAGLGGHGGSSYINGIVCRWKDANTAWTSASDGTLEEGVYYAQNWRGDVSALVSDSGVMLEWAKYESYGTPFGLPGGDTDSDGDCDATDVTQIQTWIDAPSYDVRGDVDLDGDVDGTDKSTVQASYEGKSLGREVISDVGNRAGYAGYMLDGNGLWHVRYRVLDSGLGRWLRRDPLIYADGLNLFQNVRANPLIYVDPAGENILDFPSSYPKPVWQKPCFVKADLPNCGDDCELQIRIFRDSSLIDLLLYVKVTLVCGDHESGVQGGGLSPLLEDCNAFPNFGPDCVVCIGPLFGKRCPDIYAP